MSMVAIITARGGSKRIPKKNIKDFCGKPIIAYSIEAALGSGLFDEVMVSTDSKEIADVAVKYGAVVPFMRSAKTSDDFSGTADVLFEVITEYEKRGRHFDEMCCIYPTAPFVTSERLSEAYHSFKASGADILTPVVRFSYPPQRGFIMRDGLLEYNQPEYINSRSQDLEPIYHDVGQFYFYDTAKFEQAMTKGAPLRTAAFQMDEIEVQDIDNPSDWELAELKYRMIHKK